MSAPHQPTPDPSNEQRSPRRRRSRSLFVLVTLVSTLIGLEVLLRVLPIEIFAIENLVLDESPKRYMPHPYLAYIPRPNWSSASRRVSASHNSLGFRGPEFERKKPDNTYRVIALGGSSTYGHGPSSNEKTWPLQLQRMLGAEHPELDIEVINAGTSGYSTYESLINLAIRLIDLDPDLVLVYHSINDVRCWEWPGLKPDNTHFRAVWPVLEESPVERALEGSRVYLVIRRYLMGYDLRQELGTWVIKDYGKKQMLYEFHSNEGPTHFKRNLENMVILCRLRKIQIAFGQQAYYPDDLERPADYKGLDTAYKFIDWVGRERKVPVCDVKTAMPLQRDLFTNDVHVTDEGARVMARIWADFIEENRFIERRQRD